MIYPHWPACEICTSLADMSDGFIPIGWVRIGFTTHVRIASETEERPTFTSHASIQSSLYCCAECHKKHPALVLTLSVIAPIKEEKGELWPAEKN